MKRIDDMMRAAMSFPKGFAVTQRFGFAFILIVSFSFAPKATAQFQYTPEHTDVEIMVTNAVGYMNNSRSQKIGESTLKSLAIVQAHKRYYQEVPRDNQVVNATIERILAMFPKVDPESGGPGGTKKTILNQDEVYFPCLATILLAEFDKVKYKDQIKQLIKALQDRQRPNGAFTYLKQPNSADTSQTQYVALALMVAKHHGFRIDKEVADKTLKWLVASQQPGGYWEYKLFVSDPNSPGKSANLPATHSIQAAALGSAYLMADVLQLSKRKKSMSKAVTIDSQKLPGTVMVYAQPLDDDEDNAPILGPLVKFDMGGLSNSYRAGNAWLEQNFDIAPNRWKYYYLYALERYAWFREQSEGDVGDGAMRDWYDRGVNHLLAQQEDNGRFRNKTFQAENDGVATAFAVLFLVRSSEIFTMASKEGELLGGLGFKQDTELRSKNGEIQTTEAERGLADMMNLLDKDLSEEEMQSMMKSLKKAVVEFKQKDNKSRGEIKSFLRSMVSAKSYFRRFIAIRFLAGEQDMDNVPALLYALGDPDFRICLGAHDGLRLISRRIDSLAITESSRNNAQRSTEVLTPEENGALRLEFNRKKEEWTEWFLKIRPGAELLD